jgi:hypothetical protein
MSLMIITRWIAVAMLHEWGVQPLNDTPLNDTVQTGTPWF